MRRVDRISEDDLEMSMAMMKKIEKLMMMMLMIEKSLKMRMTRKRTKKKESLCLSSCLRPNPSGNFLKVFAGRFCSCCRLSRWCKHKKVDVTPNAQETRI